MAHHECQCGRKIVVRINHRQRHANRGFKFRSKHDLCDKCNRSLRDRIKSVPSRNRDYDVLDSNVY